MTRAQVKLRFAGLVSLGLALAIIHRWAQVQDLSLTSTVLRGLLVTFLALSAFFFIRVSLLFAPRYADAKVLLLRYLYVVINDRIGAYFAKRREYESAHCQETQEKFLLNLLSRRAKTAYGKDHRFADIKSVAKFRQRHPLTKYAHYAEYMERVARGERNVVTASKTTRIGRTSGTTGKPKLIAVTMERQLISLFKMGAMVTHLVEQRHAPDASPLQTFLYLYVHTDSKLSEGGIKMGPITTLALPDLLFRLLFVTPPAGMRLTNEHQAIYVHSLFGLRDRTIKSLVVIFASALLSFFNYLEENWPKLVEDLRRGRVSDDVGLDAEIKAALEAELEPEPERAAELEREFKKGFDGIAKRIWPHMLYILAISSGPQAPYARRTEKTYAKGLPIVSQVYNATEGVIGTYYGDEYQYLIDVADIFYEFIPVDKREEDQPDTLLAEEVQVGESYELVVTNMDALFRYRMGDIVKIAGFHKKCPIVDFQYRSGELLNLRGEKTTDINIRMAVTQTFASALGNDASLVDYACVESVLYDETMGLSATDRDACYVIFVELDRIVDTCKGKNKDEVALKLDETLRTLASGYEFQRSRNAIPPLKLICLQPGSFEALRAYVLANSSATAQQVKIPKKLLKGEWIRLLADREVQ
ncbi:uncharacterized protein [Diadema setosum]|uniref:uncharacterized protein n=1 Tax=Diadema setosum TaxID=31175 RepID=UPI003B3AD400